MMLPEEAITRFSECREAAERSDELEPTAMCLSSVREDGGVSSRMVLLKDWDETGFVFYTNYNSHKGRELLANPKVCLSFFWPQLERQIRINGTAVKQDAAGSDAYFNLRPRGSKVGAWASPQSEVISGRELLEQEAEKVEARFASGEVSRPPHWGGFVVAPSSVEFWQGRPSRLHDRIRYRMEGNVWLRERLAP